MGRISIISSKDNVNIKAVSQLQKSSKKRREEGVFVLEGQRLCFDALKNGFKPIKVFLSKSFSSKNSDLIKEFYSTTDIYEVVDSIFEKISDTVNPQGILCIFSIPCSNDIQVRSNGKYIALDNIQDPSNLGAISRTAEAFAVDGIIVEGGCDPYSSKSLRASMGALLRIPVIETEDMFEIFKRNNLTSFASVVKPDAMPINDAKFKDGCAVIIGNEANGVSEKVINNADYKFTIPMSGKAESLNAAVAASIIIWEMCK